MDYSQDQVFQDGAGSFENRLKVQEINHMAYRIRNEISKVIVGQERVLDMMLTALLANGHVLLEGVPGVAKTLMAKLLARCIDTGYSRIQFTPDLMPSDVLGTTIFNTATSSFEFNAGPVFSNIVLIDEVNRAPAKTQSALFELMEERQVTIDGATRKMSRPFLVLATQNPVEHEGTYRLPEAQLDRFLMRLSLGYPGLEDEIEMLHNLRKQHPIDSIAQVVDGKELLDMQDAISDVNVDATLEKYILTLVQATRTHPSLALGASPRGSLAVYKTAQALAALRGRDFVKPDDIKILVPVTLAHRLVLKPESQLRGRTAAGIIQEILEQTELDIGSLR